MVKRSSIVRILFLLTAIIYICLSVAYYFYFSNSQQIIFYNYFNTHDHHVYKQCIDKYIDDDFSCIGLNNNFGISYLYYFLYKLFSVFNEDFNDIVFLALLVNSITLCILLIFNYLILRFLGLLKGRVIFIVLLNLSLIYFFQLINKDLLTLLAISLTTYLLLTRRFWLLILLIPLFFMIRIQLVMYILATIFLVRIRQRKTAVFLIYIITSILGGLVASKAGLIGNGLETGISNLVYQVNQKYYLGSFLLNPLRAIVFLISPFKVLSTELIKSSQVNMFLLLNIPVISIYFILFWQVFFPKLNEKRLSRAHWILIASIISYVLVWLMNPTINVRYVLLIVPNIILLGLYNKKISREL